MFSLCFHLMGAHTHTVFEVACKSGTQICPTFHANFGEVWAVMDCYGLFRVKGHQDAGGAAVRCTARLMFRRRITEMFGKGK